MSNEDETRAFFETRLPSEFMERPTRGEGFRCRFHISGAGAWEVNLGTALSLASCVDARNAPGDYDAVVYMSADDFELARRSTGAALSSIVGGGQVKTTGDVDLAREMLTILAKGPPFDWMPLRVRRVGSAFVRGTRDELLAALPGWRSRLEQPRRRVGRDPFTGGDIEVVDFDPGGPEAPEPPLAPALPFVETPWGEHWWWDPLLDFYLSLEPRDEWARALRDDADTDSAHATERVFPQALFGHEALWISSVPSRLPAAAAELTNERCKELAVTLTPKSQPRWREVHMRWLCAFAELSRLALANDQCVWFWGVL